MEIIIRLPTFTDTRTLKCGINMNVTSTYGSPTVLQFTRDCADRLLKNQVQGDFVECGVATGSQIGAMQDACQANLDARTIWAYDSFKGIPYAGEHDDQQPGWEKKDESKSGLLESTGVAAHSKECVLQNFKNWGLHTLNLKLVEGWFQDTVPHNTIDKIALLRLDGDLYESTKVCMQYLFPKLVKGGILIIDDWGLKGCRNAVLEFIDQSKMIEFEYTAYYIQV